MDDKVKKILDQLGGADCGACGYDSCEDCAKAIAKGDAENDACVIVGEISI